LVKEQEMSEVEKVHDTEDVTTWTDVEFHTKSASKLRTIWTKLETVKNLLRDGKHVVSYEHTQGCCDAIAFLLALTEKRASSLQENNSENDSE